MYQEFKRTGIMIKTCHFGEFYSDLTCAPDKLQVLSVEGSKKIDNPWKVIMINVKFIVKKNIQYI